MNKNYYLVVPPGLELGAKRELEEVGIELQREFGFAARIVGIEISRGGLSFSAPPHIAYQLNSRLKIPSRLLERWLEFRVRDFPKLYQKLKQAPWQSSVFAGGLGAVEIAASQSRLNNEKRIEKVLSDVLRELNLKMELKSGPTLYVRVHNDICTMSIDTSGEHLHFRSYRQEQGEAPLRENFAAFLWQFLTEGISASELSEFHVVDPMVGSGTLLFEALLWDKDILTRNYVSQSWLSAGKLKNGEDKETALRQRGGGEVKAFSKNSSEDKDFNFEVWGFDKNPEVLAKAQSNYQRLANIYKKITKAHFAVQDLEDPQWALPTELLQKKRLLLSNPPYGERLKLKGASCLELCGLALQKYSPAKAVFLVPDSAEARVRKELSGYGKEAEVAFSNSGLRVLAQRWAPCITR